MSGEGLLQGDGGMSYTPQKRIPKKFGDSTRDIRESSQKLPWTKYKSHLSLCVQMEWSIIKQCDGLKWN